MCSALRREPHFENGLSPIREVLASFLNECARRYGESHMLETGCPQSVKLLLSVRTNVRRSKARATL
eukprot:3477231-Pyramimonas_sp.AAC.1